ncbi:magnesium transporter CorA family protein [SAR92 clade bacterium H231]|nr:magnesium transporter CorA family protein [SAR92 clade bacterium H231]
MIRVCVFNGTDTAVGGTELIALPLPTGTSLWIDICRETPAAEEIIFDQFGCHPLCVQDARRERHPPKTEHFKDQSFVLLRALKSVCEGLSFETQQVACFIGHNYLITRHDETSGVIDNWWNFGDVESPMAKGPWVLFAAITNSMGLAYIDMLLEFEPTLSGFEDSLLDSPSDELLRELISCKTSLRKLKRMQSYHEAAYAELLQHFDNDNLTFAESRHAVTDVYEKFERLHSLSSLYYDLAGDLIDGHISLTSHRLNDTMRILTVVTAIFVPLGFLAGLYGMNFDNMPELHQPNGYFILVGVMASIALGLVALFKRNKWL